MENFNEKPIRPSQRRQKGRWWIPLSMIVLAMIVLFIITIVGTFSYMISSIENFGNKNEPKIIKEKTVLKLDCSSLSEVNNTDRNPFTFIFNDNAPTATFYDVIEAIKYAAKDPNIVGIYYDGKCYLSGTMLKEMQIALAKFKESGKFIYSYLSSADKTTYYMTLLSDSIFVPDEGMYEFSGFSVSNVFMKGLYDKIGLEYDVVQCEDFKTAAEPYKNTKFSDSARLEYKVLITQKENDFINSVAKYRNINNEKVISIMNEGILDAEQMINYKLADKKVSQIYVDNLLSNKTNTQNNKKDTTIEEDIYNSIGIDDYVYTIAEKFNETYDDKIAIISGEGAIVDSEIQNNPFLGGTATSIVSSDFVKLIKEAKENDKIKGIIIRINSPGGSVTASEEIYQAILDAKKTKPVYASMSDVAASGGYYISMACDTIIADSATITGSIGVVAAFPNISKVMKNLYMNVDTISNGIGNPYFLNPMLSRDAKNSATFEKIIKNTYTRFITKAASCRRMNYEDLHKAAKGRVWLGKDAKEKGLVDVLGNLQTAITMMKKRIGKDSKKIELVFMPKAENTFKSLMKLFKKNNVSTQFTINNNAELLIKSMIPIEYQKQISYLMLLSQITQKEKMVIAMPELIEIR